MPTAAVFVVPWAELEPRDAAWRRASPKEKRAYHLEAARVVVRVRRRSLIRGIGLNGRKLRQIALSTMKNRRSWTGHGDPAAPPLVPAYGRSRTVDLFRAKAEDGGLRCFWGRDPVSGRLWGVIVEYHGEGGPNLPKRDVRGIPWRDMKEIRAELEAWWRRRGERQRAREDAEAESEEPEAVGPRRIHGVRADLVAKHGIRFHDFEHLDAGAGIGSVSGGSKPAKVITFTRGGITGPPKTPRRPKPTAPPPLTIADLIARTLRGRKDER